MRWISLTMILLLSIGIYGARGIPGSAAPRDSQPSSYDTLPYNDGSGPQHASSRSSTATCWPAAFYGIPEAEYDQLPRA